MWGKETVNHIVQCPARAAEKRKTVKDFDQMLETMKTTDDVRHALSLGIELWMHGKNVRNRIALTERTRKAVDDQNKIGWDMAMRGRLASGWAVIQEHNGDGVPRGGAGNRLGDSWSAQVGGFLLQESRKYWFRRNEEKQKSSSVEQPDRPRAEVEAETRVRSLYNRINELSEQDRRIFDLPVEQRLRLPAKHQELWADRTLSTVNRLAQKERERLKQRQGNIWSLWATAASMVQHAVEKVATRSKGVRGVDKETNETGPGKTNQATTEAMSKNQVGQAVSNATSAAERQAGEKGGMGRRHAAAPKNPKP
jgi:hypothetical protein